MANAQSDDDMEDLEANAAVMLMANMQELHLTESGPAYDSDTLSQVHNFSTCFIHDIVTPSESASTSKQSVQNEALFSKDENYQLDTVVVFDDDQINSDVSIDNSLQVNNVHLKPFGFVPHDQSISKH